MKGIINPDVSLLLLIGICISAVAIGITDFLTYRIPNILIIIFVSCTILFEIMYRKQYVCEYILSCTLFFTIYFIIFKHIGGLGFGDVKFAAAIGLLLGFSGAFAAVIAATATAIVYALGLYAKSIIKKQEKNFRTIKIPYGTFLSAGAVFVFLMRQMYFL